MGRVVFALSMLGGTVLIFAHPDWFLPDTSGCFDCSSRTEAQVVSGAVGITAAVLVMALAPTALAFSLWRRLVSLREYGTTSVTRDQSLALMRNHLSLRVLSHTTMLLALIAGGLIVQLGYMSSLGLSP